MHNDFIINKLWTRSNNCIFAHEFEILHYSDFFYFSVGRKKMVGTKKGLSGENGESRAFYLFHCFT